MLLGFSLNCMYITGMIKILILSFLSCILVYAHEKNQPVKIRAHGYAYVPIVILVDVIHLDDSGQPMFIEHDHTKKLRFQWSETARIYELDPSKIRPLDRYLAKPQKPVLIDQNNSATIWTRLNWVRSGEHVSYNFNGNLKVSTDRYTVIDKPLKHFIKNTNAKDINFGAILIHLQLTFDKKTHLLKEYQPAPPQPEPQKVIPENHKLLPNIEENQ